MAMRGCGCRKGVSIHAPARGATVSLPAMSPGTPSFNSRARKGRDHSPGVPGPAPVRFNSRARKGRDICDTNTLCQFAVSIHAPARGATPSPSASSGPTSFNSRARKGRDNQPQTPLRRLSCFNSRARKGRDGKNVSITSKVRVSIHAPARGATSGLSEAAIRAMFQFTRPQGARPSLPAMSPVTLSFNSRARKGRDLAMLGINVTGCMFQFTRPQGARR